MKRYRKTVLLALLLLTISTAGYVFWQKHSTPKTDEDIVLINEWYQLALEIETDIEGIAVPVAGRFYGYFGFIPMTIEASEKGQLDQLSYYFPNLDLSKIKNRKNTRFGPAFNKAAKVFLSRYYINIPYHLNKKAEDIENKWNQRWMKELGPEITEHSKNLGRDIANAVYAWSEEDEQGHQAYLHNFDKDYDPPKGPGLWKEDDEHPMPALLPHWGKVRTFVINADEFIATPLPPYSTDHNSIYYIQALELFTISAPLSYENKWISEYWSDDVRGLTFTPSGRWISILNQFVLENKVPRSRAIEAYFKLGIGISDALVACWNSKYIYNLERPQDFIRKNIHEDWRSFHHSPNFPSYPSGHSTIGGVSSTILANIFGDTIDFTDKSHEGRIEFQGKARHFTSFKEMAEENAYSRIPLGVHYRIDCQEGLRLGESVGKRINQIKFTVPVTPKKVEPGKPISAI